MATKPHNIAHFYGGRGYGYVRLVKRSLGRHTGLIPHTSRLGLQYPEMAGKHINYWRGQLVHDWEGCNPATGERCRFTKGQVIWLDAGIFHQLNTADYIDYTNT